MATLSTQDADGRVVGIWANCNKGKTFATIQADENNGASIQVWPSVDNKSLPFGISGNGDTVHFQFPGPKGNRTKVRIFTSDELVDLLDDIVALKARVDHLEGLVG